jgi:hypothetical protein
MPLPRIPADGQSKNYALTAETVHKAPIRFPVKAQGLYHWAGQLVFFSPALAYLYGGLSDLLLTDFLQGYNRAVTFYHHRFDRPLFRGLTAPSGNTDWNHVLWAVDAEHWGPLLDHLCSTVDVHVLAVKTNRQTYALDLEEQRGPLEPPQLKLYGADAQCQSLARALFPESR